VIETAWDEYRGWAKRSRSLQTSVQSWNLAALACAVLAAVLGAAASQVPAESTPGRVLAGLAAVAAAVTPILGRYMLEVGGEAGWIRARATAETLKSECFLFAAGAGEYGGADAQAKLIEKRNALTKPATEARLMPQDDPVGPAGDKRRPPVPMPANWYVQNRLNEQIGFYSKRGADYELQLRWLRAAGLVCALAGAVLGAVASALQVAGLTPWIGVATTLGAMVVAYGLMERRQYLAASYAAMATALRRLKEPLVPPGGDKHLVEDAEALMSGEHAAWVERMTQTIAAPTTVPAPAAPAPAGPKS
jgi:hypothetical protein